MAKEVTPAVNVCSLCGEQLNAKGECLACLLRAGLDQSIAGDAPRVSLGFGDFEIAQREDGSLWELGRGAMGMTYLAADNVLRRKVALKVIEVPAAARGSQAVRERFLREARAAAGLRHPNVAAVYQFGASPNGSRCYYAMELVDGETLETRVRRDGPLDAKLVLEIGIQMARALVAATAQGLIHRDLKPSNIMLRRDDAVTAELEVKLIDFGLAKALADAGRSMDLTHGQFVGTPNFASPEQFRNSPVDVRSDIYSLGATLWFAITGLTPRSGSTIEEIRDRQIGDHLPVEQLVARKVPEPLIKLLRSMLAVDPCKRPASAHELLEALKELRRKVEFEAFFMGDFFDEVKRRKVYRVAAAYIIVAAGIIQLASAAFPAWELPNWTLRLVIVLLLIGFPLALILGWAFDVTSQGIRATPRPVLGTHRRRNVVMLVAAGVVISAAAGFFLLPRVSVHKVESIAVLPFENLSNNPDAEYLSEGISEALINSLTDLQQLRVIARSTAFHYKGKDVDPRRVGRELQVATVLTGRLRQRQDALNVQVDLVDVNTGAQLWGAGYDRKISDVIAIKQAIAREVTEKLKLKLSGEEQRRLVKRDSSNAEAYQVYLRGRYFWNKRTADGIQRAFEQFQQAIERDPNFALGHVGLADSYTALTFYNFAAPHEAMPKAKESALKALALDNTLAEAHASLAHISMNYYWDWPTAEKEFKRSMELKPDYATAHQWYAIHYLTATGRLDEALEEMKKALELEPVSLVMNTFMGVTLYHAGRYDEAIDQCRRTIEMDPNFAVAHWHLGLAYEQKQAFDAAIEEFQRAIALSGGSPLMRAALGHAYAMSEKTYEANKILNELNELSTQQYVSPYEVAAIYVALGNNEKALQLLEKACTEHSFHFVNLNVSPLFKSVRSDPRFQDLVRRVGLLQ